MKQTFSIVYRIYIGTKIFITLFRFIATPGKLVQQLIQSKTVVNFDERKSKCDGGAYLFINSVMFF